LRLKPGGRALPFTAVEEMEVERVAFTWRARFPLMLRVVDGYADGKGMLVARVLGVPVSRAEGPEVARGEAMRYLAELPWVPHAFVANAELDWRELDARRVEVSTEVTGARTSVVLAFDDDGDVVRASADRPRADSGRVVTTPWSGTFRDYAVVGGVRVPTTASVQWVLPEGPFVYWEGTVVALESLHTPVAAASRT